MPHQDSYLYEVDSKTGKPMNIVDLLEQNKNLDKLFTRYFGSSMVRLPYGFLSPNQGNDDIKDSQRISQFHSARSDVANEDEDEDEESSDVIKS